jgi:hypothetical protein
MTVTFDITIAGVQETIARLHALPAAAEAAQRAVIKRLGDRYLAVLKADSPIGRGEQPGGLLRAYKTEESYTPTAARYRITNDYPALKWVLGGRGPVEASRAKALRFVISGQVFYRRRVGPAAANRFDERARARMAGEVANAANEIRARIVRGSP